MFCYTKSSDRVLQAAATRHVLIYEALVQAQIVWRLHDVLLYEVSISNYQPGSVCRRNGRTEFRTDHDGSRSAVGEYHGLQFESRISARDAAAYAAIRQNLSQVCGCHSADSAGDCASRFVNCAVVAQNSRTELSIRFAESGEAARQIRGARNHARAAPISEQHRKFRTGAGDAAFK